jgi:hypothetical protein
MSYGLSRRLIRCRSFLLSEANIKLLPTTMEFLLDRIIQENEIIQNMNAEGGPNNLAAAHEHVTKLVWKLKQIDQSNVSFIQAWNMLVDYGEKDLRAMLLYHNISAIKDYTYAFSRLKLKISRAVALLSNRQSTVSATPSSLTISVSAWHVNGRN